MKMTLLELQTRLVEIVAELQTNEEHSAAIREQVKQLILDERRLKKTLSLQNLKNKKNGITTT